MEAAFGFVDLVGFTALTKFHGDEAELALAERFEAISADAIVTGDREMRSVTPS